MMIMLPRENAPLLVAGPEIALANLDQMFPKALTCAAADLYSIVNREAENRDVIFVTEDRTLALRVSSIMGATPVWLTNSGVNVLADSAVAVVHDILHVSPYLHSAVAAPLRGLARWRPSDTRAMISSRLELLVAAAINAGGLCIYGAGTIGRQAIAAARLARLPIKAIVDANPTLHGTCIDGIEVRPVSSIESGVDVVVPALGRHIAAVTKTLKCRAVHDIMTLSELYYLSRRPGEPETDYLDDLFANRHRYHSLFMGLADERSREVLSAVVKHRLSLATESLIEVAEHGHPQWFDPAFLPKTEEDVFVDGGAFDGDTALGYVLARGSGYKHIHAFEIDKDVAARAAKRTAHLPKITIHNCGLSDRQSVASYRKTGSTDGAIGQPAEGAHLVELQTIDAAILERITFLKLDVEGEEAKTIDGARRHLVEDRPALAVALYHKAHDLWDLPRRILDLLPDYRLYMRHYTDIAYETIVYATSQENRRGLE